MMTRVVSLLLLLAMLAQAQPAPVRAEWSHTPEVLAGKWVLVKLQDGTIVEGSWASVTDSTLTMIAEKSSGTRKLSKGLQTIPRSEVRQIRFRERRVRRRVIGTITGFYTGLVLAAAATRTSEAMQSGWGLAAIAGAVGGYHLGKSFDQRTRELITEP